MQAETGSYEGAPAPAATGIRRLHRFTTDQKGTSMKTLRAGLTALLGATMLLVALPGIAGAATTGTTTTTFTLTGGAISITVPGSTVTLQPTCTRQRRMFCFMPKSRATTWWPAGRGGR